MTHSITHNKPVVLFIAGVWPESLSSAAGHRTMQLIDFFIQQDYQIHFACAAQFNDFSDELNKQDIICHEIKLNESSFDAVLNSIQAAIVVYDRFFCEEQYGWRVQQCLPKALTILDTCDLHFLRRARQHALKTNTEINLYNDDSTREIAAIYRCDIALIISDIEYSLLRTQFNIPARQLLYLPFMLNRKKLYSPQQAFAQRQHMVMIGNFLHAPNKDAVLYCLKELWPEIRKQLKDIDLHIYGAYCPDYMHQYHNPKKGIHIKGRMEYLYQGIENYRLNLAPLRFGAGIKGKIIDGFIAGTPCVCSSIAAEGMQPDKYWGGLIADDKQEFIQSCVDLYHNHSLWQEKQNQGYKNIEQVHNEQKNQHNLAKKIDKVIQKLEKWREKNFIGTMLNYHHHQRTKYLSRWIEEKNKTK